MADVQLKFVVQSPNQELDQMSSKVNDTAKSFSDAATNAKSLGDAIKNTGSVGARAFEETNNQIKAVKGSIEEARQKLQLFSQARDSVAVNTKEFDQLNAAAKKAEANVKSLYDKIQDKAPAGSIAALKAKLSDLVSKRNNISLDTAEGSQQAQNITKEIRKLELQIGQTEGKYNEFGARVKKGSQEIVANFFEVGQAIVGAFNLISLADFNSTTQEKSEAAAKAVRAIAVAESLRAVAVGAVTVKTMLSNAALTVQKGLMAAFGNEAQKATKSVLTLATGMSKTASSTSGLGSAFGALKDPLSLTSSSLSVYKTNLDLATKAKEKAKEAGEAYTSSFQKLGKSILSVPLNPFVITLTAIVALYVVMEKVAEKLADTHKQSKVDIERYGKAMEENITIMKAYAAAQEVIATANSTLRNKFGKNLSQQLQEERSAIANKAELNKADLDATKDYIYELQKILNTDLKPEQRKQYNDELIQKKNHLTELEALDEKYIRDQITLEQEYWDKKSKQQQDRRALETAALIGGYNKNLQVISDGEQKAFDELSRRTGFQEEVGGVIKPISLAAEEARKYYNQAGGDVKQFQKVLKDNLERYIPIVNGYKTATEETWNDLATDLALQIKATDTSIAEESRRFNLELRNIYEDRKNIFRDVSDKLRAEQGKPLTGLLKLDFDTESAKIELNRFSEELKRRLRSDREALINLQGYITEQQEKEFQLQAKQIKQLSQIRLEIDSQYIKQRAELEKQLIEKIQGLTGTQKEIEISGVKKQYSDAIKELQNYIKGLQQENVNLVPKTMIAGMFNPLLAANIAKIQQANNLIANLTTQSNNKVANINAKDAVKSLEALEKQAEAELELEFAAAGKSERAAKEKNKRKLALDIEYAKKKIDLLEKQLTTETGADADATKLAITNLKTLIKSSQAELTGLGKGVKIDLFELLGIKFASDADRATAIKQLQTIADQSIQIFNSLAQQQIDNLNKTVAANQEVIDELDNQINEKQAQIDKDLDNKKRGVATNLILHKKELEALKKSKEEELKIQQANKDKIVRIEKEKAIASNITSTVNMIATVSQMFKDGAEKGGIIGALIAIAAVATVVGSFLSIKAALSAPSKLEKGGRIKGKRHSNGGHRIEGTDIEVEDGEWVVNRKSSAKYNKILDAINKDKFDSLSNIDILPLLKNTGISINKKQVREIEQIKLENKIYETSKPNLVFIEDVLSKSEKHLLEVKKEMQKEKITHLNDGTKIIQSKNETRIIR